MYTVCAITEAAPCGTPHRTPRSPGVDRRGEPLSAGVVSLLCVGASGRSERIRLAAGRNGLGLCIDCVPTSGVQNISRTQATCVSTVRHVTTMCHVLTASYATRGCQLAVQTFRWATHCCVPARNTPKCGYQRITVYTICCALAVRLMCIKDL